MKITKVEAIPVRQPGEMLLINDSAQDGVIIRIQTDEGITGYGEVDSAPWVIKSIIESPVSHRICRGLATVVEGRDPQDVVKIWDDMYVASLFYGGFGAAIHAMSGIDIAIWDILGKAANLPVYKLLGGKYRDNVRLYASTLMPYTPEEAAESALKWKADGYTAIKMGWGGFEQGIRKSVKLAEAARQAVGDDIDLLFDIGFIPSAEWTVEAPSIIQLVKELEPFNPYLIEEPLFPHDYEGYKRLQAAVTTRIACGENSTTLGGFKTLIDYCGLSIVQPDISRCGGITEARRIANYAAAKRINIIPHAWSSDILIAASLHVIASIPNNDIMEFCVWDTPIRKEMIRNPFVAKDGYVSIPDGPGLGVEINDEAIEKYRVDKY
ncbi:MAG: mandelate racemase/muconate lactonizing enzyme family protein [Christensenellales bacterium]|jgi:L-rhamnonate dehydratase